MDFNERKATAYRPVHSDYLIHWTGLDIDKDDSNWIENGANQPSDDIVNRYLDRLRSILRTGIWMNHEPVDDSIEISRTVRERPNPYRACFTELRLSAAWHHAMKFGRLGIGFKRFFVLERMGAPMIYVHQRQGENWLNPSFGPAFDNDQYWTAFLKPMCGESRHGYLTYDVFDESEWRIIFDEHIRMMLENNGRRDIAAKFVSAEDEDDPLFREFHDRAPTKPGYLIPIRDKWFAMIIYPSISVKARSMADQEIREIIREIKPPVPSDLSTNINSAAFEKHNPPFETDLNACRHY